MSAPGGNLRCPGPVFCVYHGCKMQLKEKANYYKEIDGIRALAVCLVLLFHLQIFGFSGGFVGVDVFFVISGYLITGIIYEDVVRSGQFSYNGFFVRRFKRLFPALAAVVLFGFWIGENILRPYDFKMLGGSAVAALLGISNVYFWKGSGYFDSLSLVKPLLHTWSLGVEMQFYIIWPFFIVFLCKKVKKTSFALLVLALVAVSSLYANLIIVHDRYHFTQFLIEHVDRAFRERGSAIFYLMPFRIFEFSIGAAIVWIERSPRRPGWFGEVASLIGLAMILWAGIWFGKNLTYPSFYALLPCVGTALMILAAKDSRIVGAGLRHPLVRGIGLISYSLYLVHWPAMVFYRYVHTESWGVADKAFVLAISIVVSVLMYHFIEKPFRRISAHQLAFWRFRFWALAASVMLVIGILPAHAYMHGGWGWRFPAKVANLIARTDASNRTLKERAAGCSFTNFDDFNVKDCVQPEPGKINILVMGDSVAERIWMGLRNDLPESKYNLLQLSPSNCRPGYGWGVDYCLKSNDFIFKYLKNHDIDLTIFASLGPDYANFAKTLDYMRKIKRAVWVIGMPFIFNGRLPDIIAAAKPLPVTDSEVNQVARDGLLSNTIALRQNLEKIAVEKNVPYFDLQKQICEIQDDLSTCNFIIDGGLITADNNHLTPDAAEKVLMPLAKEIISKYP